MKSRPQEILMSGPQEILMSGPHEVLKSGNQSLLKSWTRGFLITWSHVLLASRALDILFFWSHDTLISQPPALLISVGMSLCWNMEMLEHSDTFCVRQTNSRFSLLKCKIPNASLGPLEGKIGDICFGGFAFPSPTPTCATATPTTAIER